MTQSIQIEYILFVGADPSAPNSQAEDILVSYLGIIASFIERSAKATQSKDFAEAFDKLPGLVMLDDQTIKSNDDQSVAIATGAVADRLAETILTEMRLSKAYCDAVRAIVTPAIAAVLDAEKRPDRFTITWLLAIVDNTRADSPTLNNLTVTLSGAFHTWQGDPPFDKPKQILTISSTGSWTGYALVKSQTSEAQDLIETLCEQGNVKNLRKLGLLKTFTIKPAA